MSKALFRVHSLIGAWVSPILTRGDGGTIKYQPISANAAAWRSFMNANGLFCEARVRALDALGVAKHAARVGIAFTLPSGGIPLSLGGQSLVVKLGFGGLASLVMRKGAPVGPLAQRSALVHLTGTRYQGRHHQVPAYQRERGSMAELHGLGSSKGAWKSKRPDESNAGTSERPGHRPDFSSSGLRLECAVA
jgi:hypothetical protein